MKLTPPSIAIFLISLVLFLLGCLGHFGILSLMKDAYEIYALVASWVVLALGCLFKGI